MSAVSELRKTEVELPTPKCNHKCYRIIGANDITQVYLEIEMLGVTWISILA